MRGFMRTALATAAVVLSAPVWAEGSTQDEIARYREMLAEGNPAELLEAKGEELWKKPRGPRNVSLERCDLGLGPGQVQGAYARLPRYFADTRQVMDVESRLVHCMVTLQGFTREEATRNWYSRPGKDSDIEALVTYIGGQSNGVAIDVPARHPEEARMARIGELIFYRRSGPQDFSCAICHGQEGKRIRLQELGKLTTRAGAGTAMANWPSYRVSQGAVWTMQRRLIDCMRQARWPEPKFPSETVVALQTYLQVKANGGELKSPSIKR